MGNFGFPALSHGQSSQGDYRVSVQSLTPLVNPQSPGFTVVWVNGKYTSSRIHHHHPARSYHFEVHLHACVVVMVNEVQALPTAAEMAKEQPQSPLQEEDAENLSQENGR